MDTHRGQRWKGKQNENSEEIFYAETAILCNTLWFWNCRSTRLLLSFERPARDEHSSLSQIINYERKKFNNIGQTNWCVIENLVLVTDIFVDISWQLDSDSDSWFWYWEPNGKLFNLNQVASGLAVYGLLQLWNSLVMGNWV